MIRIIFLAFVLQIVLGTALTAQTDTAPDLRFATTVQRVGQGQWDIRADLGEIPVAPSVQITLSVSNPTNEDVHLGNTFSGCKCLKATLSADTIKANSVEEIRLTLSGDKEKREATRWVVLTISPKDLPERNTRIHLKYSVAGVLLFSQNSAAFAIPENAKNLEFRVPILFTPPVKPEELRAYGEGGLHGLEGVVVRNGDGHELKFSIEKDAVGEGVAGWLVIAHPQTSQADKISCTIDVQKNLECTPSTLQFKWSDEDRVWIAHALVRALPDAKSKSTLTSSSDVRVVARADNAEIECKVTQLKHGIARVEVRATFEEGKAINSQSEKLVWFVNYQGAEFRDSCKFVLRK